MSDFTYEFENKNNRLEKYEWDNVWWECADTAGIPRVLYIGDSISCATRRFANEAAGHGIFFDGFGTSKALDNPYFFDSIRLFAAQLPYRDAVIFNNGLHGWHLEDENEYRAHYERAVEFLMREFAGTPIWLVLTTTVRNETREARVCARNRVVREIAEKFGLPIIDLYRVSSEFVALRAEDGVHYSRDGYTKFADHILETVTANV